MKNGGQLLVDALKVQGTEHVFCVPGESYLPVLDALYDSGISNTICRQEGGAAMMAEAWGKVTGAPGICFVTRGPGATNASAGVHIAAQDSTAMILFIGQVHTGMRYREAFQELDYQQFFGGIAKWVAEIDSTERIAEMISRAWHVATSGRPGPVVLALPEDTLQNEAISVPVNAWQQIETVPGAEQMVHCEALLAAAKTPLVIVGGSRWTETAVEQLTQFSERTGVPVATSFRRQMLFDHTHPHYAGDVGLNLNPALRKRIDAADLLLLIGCRLPELPAQDYTLLQIPTPTQTLIHVHPGAEELGRVYKPTLGIHASPDAFCAALAQLTPTDKPDWRSLSEQANREYKEWSSLHNAVDSAAFMAGVIAHLKQRLPADTIITNGAGNYSTWLHRFYPFKQFGTQVSPISGSMGYGVPAAIAAKLARPEQIVVAFAGDGCFQMTCQEFGTAVQAGAAIIVLVIDNAMYGTIRMHQEKTFPGRVSATTLENPDFAAWARAYGVYAATVNTLDEFESAFSAALDSNGPALLHLHVDPQAITPTLSLSDL